VTRHNPDAPKAADPLQANGAEQAPVIPHSATLGAKRPTVVVPIHIDRRHPRPPVAFSLRKRVPAWSGQVGGDADVGARQAAFLKLPANVPSTPKRSRGPESVGDPALQSESAGAPHSAMLSGLRWAVLLRPAVEAVNLLQLAVLARLVAPAEFGRFTIAMVVLTLSWVPSQAVQYSIVQRDEIDRNHLKTGVTLTILAGLATCAVCFAASYTVVPLLFGARTAVLVRLMIPASFINAINTVQIAVLTRELDFRRLTLFAFTFNVVSALTSIALAAAGLNGTALVLGVLAGSVASFVLVCCWVLPPIPNFCLRAARDLLESGVAAAVGTASTVCFENCDYVIIGARVGALQAGYYFRAYTLSVVYQTKLSEVVSSVGFPVLSRSKSGEEIDALRQRMAHTVTLIVFPLLTALAIVAPRFVPWFYGPAWNATIAPVQILVIGGAAMLVAQTVTIAMLAEGRARAVMAWGWGHFLGYGALVFAMAHLGLTAIAIAAAVVHSTFLLISYVQLRRGSLRQALKTIARDIFPAAGSSVGLAAVALPVSLFASKLGIPTLPYLLIIALTGGAGYFLIMRLWFPSQLRYLALLARRLLPARTHRMFTRFILRPQPQSAA